MNIKATIIQHQQGSEGWLQHRARSLNASELAAVMGESSYTSRAELINQKATGIAPEVDAATQRRFDKGHEYEAAARAFAEEIIGESLYPCVLAAEVDGLYLSASLDGQDLLGDATWEHKSGRADLLASLERGVIPTEYHPQMEQGLMLSGATRCLFMASNGTRESMRSAWYESTPELRAKIIPTWKQFMADVAAYVPTAAEAPKPTGKTPETLPALHIVIQGGVSASNLDEFKETALGAIRSVNRELTTDVQFADAEKAVKWCSDIEDRIKAAKDHALSQTASIDALFRTMDEISAEARRVRLDLDKLVKARKEAIKTEVVLKAQQALIDHMMALNMRIGRPLMPRIIADFAEAIKGKKSVDTLKAAAADELARVKTEANMMADRITANLRTIEATGLPQLFADLVTLVVRDPADMGMLVDARMTTHKAAEQRRLDEERVRIRSEEVASLKCEADAKDAKEAAEDTAIVATPAAEQKPDPRPAVTHSSNGIGLATPAANDRTEDSGVRIKLGELNAILAPVSITADGLALLGFPSMAAGGTAKLYRECDVPAICHAIVRHIWTRAWP